MAVDTGETCRANQIWNPGTTGIGLHLGITAFGGEAQIRYINIIPMLPHPYQEVFGFDISIDNALGVDIFETTDKLVGEYQYGLERELAAAAVEKVFQTRAQEINHYRVIFIFRLIGVDS